MVKVIIPADMFKFCMFYSFLLPIYDMLVIIILQHDLGELWLHHVPYNYCDNNCLHVLCFGEYTVY